MGDSFQQTNNFSNSFTLPSPNPTTASQPDGTTPNPSFASVPYPPQQTQQRTTTNNNMALPQQNMGSIPQQTLNDQTLLQQNIVPTQYSNQPVQQPQVNQPVPQEKPNVDQSSMPAPTIISSQPTAYNNLITPPSSLQPFTCAVSNKSSPKNIRMSVFTPAFQGKMMKLLEIPLSCEVTPFAKMFEGEKLESVKVEPKNIKRCPRCGGYVNPFCTFEEGGKKMKCNLCEYLSDVDDNYFSPLRGDGKREDTERRIELMYGTNEYELEGKDPVYINKSCGEPMKFIFLIDVSKDSLTRVFDSVMNVLQNALQSVPELVKTLECGFVTFSNYIQYWVLGSTPRMVKVCDITEPFVPLAPKNFFKPISEVIEMIPMLNQYIRKNITEGVINDNCLVSAIESAAQMIGTTGKILAFTTSQPNEGTAALIRKPSDISSNPQTPANQYINQMAKKLSLNCIGVDLFVLPNKFSDIVTIGEIPRYTGGELFYYPNYNTKNQIKLTKDVLSSFDMDCGFDVEVRVRSSAGVFIQDYLGDVMPCKDMIDTVRIGYMNSKKSIIALMDYDDELNNYVGFFIQAVILYTDIFGQKKIKIFNGFYSTATELADVFKKADSDVILNTLIRQSIKAGNFSSDAGLNIELLDKTVSILTAYRKHCSAHAKSSILLLPEALKLVPIFVLGAMKTSAFMPFFQLNSMSTGYGINGIISDLKFASIHQTTSISIGSLLRQYYYNAYDVTGHLSGIVTSDNFSDDSFKVRLSEKNFAEDKVYLMDTGKDYKLFVGKNVSDEIKTNLFGQPIDLMNNQQDFTSLVYSNALSQPDNLLTKLIYWLAGMTFTPMVALEVIPFNKMDLSPFMLEDKTMKGVAYFDLLVYYHKKIQKKLAN
ncbi:hypothetical protein ENUP19_0055G0093 [Entamoeba nuttalli]|uniref:Protein transport protein Sec24, putative n=2 Tax=Entamoeba nuttalli TaxID=412467 RepID=K2H156_ENTNP|nr:protein transport protein Sec24, putative [Entamoeba nuttalli P19]EKE41248.1 protein transport protein Sec24, putative [Entamoeba nuttalli P19]|eukprot:XP_008856417.1 protein transport protein Sec24, putative [Entamoeba nuttalli P19]